MPYGKQLEVDENLQAEIDEMVNIKNKEIDKMGKDSIIDVQVHTVNLDTVIEYENKREKEQNQKIKDGENENEERRSDIKRERESTTLSRNGKGKFGPIY